MDSFCLYNVKKTEFFLNLEDGMKKKIWPIVCALAIVAALLAFVSCGDKSGDNTEPFEPDLEGTAELEYYPLDDEHTV